MYVMSVQGDERFDSCKHVCLPESAQRIEGTTAMPTALSFGHCAEASARGVRVNRTDCRVRASQRGIFSRIIDMSSVTLLPSSWTQ